MAVTGNGGIMRLVGIPLFVGVSNVIAAIDLADSSSRLTHGSDTARDTARLLAMYILRALSGASKEQVLAPCSSDCESMVPLAEYWERAPLSKVVKAVADGSFKIKQPPPIDSDDVHESLFIKGSGYCVETLEAALWAFYSTDSFESGALLAGVCVCVLHGSQSCRA
jgi:ADP-ribosyl-[dinitrogen reductase] hydrolase